MEKQELHLDSNVNKTSVSTPKKLECPAMISGSAFGTFGQSRQFGADLPRSQTISITGGFATLASAPASEGGFAAVATGSGGGGFDGVLSGGAPALGGELGVSSLDSDEGKQKETSAQYDITPRMMLEFEISTSTKEISDDITPSLVMAFDKVDNELNSKKEKVKKAQSEIKPDSDEGKQKETSAQYDITPRMMLEFEKSEKTKDVRNEDISDDITPSLVMAFDKVDNELNSKKDSKVVANEPVLSFGFSMIASPDKQYDFDKDLNSKKEKVESPHTETKQEDEGNEVDVSKVIEITPFLNVDAEKTFDAENKQRPKRKIILSDLLSHSNVEEMKQYMKLEEDVRMLLKEVALERIQKRMKEHLDPIEKDEDLEEKKEDPNKKNEDPKKKNEDPKKKIEDAKKKNEDPKKKNGVPKKKNANPKEKNDDVKKKQKD
ncbi:hypothetical protein SSX86_016592 [Deinandra increscens subsp. villosa]|uniref:Uncharacterized protein n=1 Tax=Deinandra increscens subsp. villosa TaxID=3103831 RepID=A0AAP0CYG6_9ASTR